jgi:hypothetical protein
MSLWSRARALSSETLTRAACVLGLVALALMVWSVVDPRVWPVLLALSVGQVVGTLSFVIFLAVVARDLGVLDRLRGRRANRAP